MTVEQVETLVVGGGQAGIAMSEHLGRLGVPHLVLERGRIAERWRTGRWDSLVANGPAWHDRFPGLEFDDVDPDGFPSKDRVAAYFDAYVEMIGAPVRCGVDVLSVERHAARPGFRVETSDGPIDAAYVVAATGPFQRPVFPRIVPDHADVVQMHSAEYRNQDQLPEGGVLVVGAGSSGTQIADELLRAGRDVYLSVGPHSRYPRRYRERDYCWWLGVLGRWDVETPDPETQHVTIAVSGAYGGFTVDFRRMAERGMTLVGLTESYADGVIRFAADLRDNLAYGDRALISELEEADAYVARNGLDLPEEPEARIIPPDPACVTDPILELDLNRAGIGTILWATGYAYDFSWLKVDVFDAQGRPRHKRGVSDEPGLYFMGLPWLSRRGSSFIWGVWHDAMYVADHIATHRQYVGYDRAARERAHR